MKFLTLLGALGVACGALSPGPAGAMVVNPAPSHKTTILKVELAEQRIHAFLKTLPNMPADVLVMPATGIVPWPGSRVNEDVKAEVWTAVAGNDPSARPFVMFAVRPDTGEVYVLYIRKLEVPTASRPN